ncbi:MAG: histidine phosphatase family protein [Clostridia bacterium]|nr:histidine phosphatase family protein [Clostridia bacterium]
MRLFFARHGETDWNAGKKIQGSTDIELNETGIQQAHSLAGTLDGKEIECIYTSRLTRASVTAGIIADALGIPCATKDGLEEICFGDWEGHTWYEVKCSNEEQYEHWKANRRDARPPHGETYGEMAERFVAAVIDIIHHSKGNVLILTHSACIQILLAEMNGTPIANMSKDYPVPNAEAIEIDPSTILNRFA